MDQRRIRGFTLVELMAVVAILAVLSTVAIFSYKAYTRKARIQEGAAFLMDIKLKQETYFMTYSRYIDTGANATDWFPANGVVMPTIWDPGHTWNCAAPAGPAMTGFCALGLTFNPDGMTYFQYVTMGWEPGDAAPDPQFIRDPQRRWWFARGKTYQGDGMTLPYELRLTSEVMEMMELQMPEGE